MRFTLMRLFFCSSLIAVSAVLVGPHEPKTEFETLARFWSGVVLFGVGIGSLYKRPVIGMIFGAIAALAVVGTIVGILFSFYIE
jgi:hypothetical protein